MAAVIGNGEYNDGNCPTFYNVSTLVDSPMPNPISIATLGALGTRRDDEASSFYIM